jgi:hypothetical protein
LCIRDIWRLNKKFGNYDVACAFFNLDNAEPKVENTNQFLERLQQLVPIVSTEYESIRKEITICGYPSNKQ